MIADLKQVKAYLHDDRVRDLVRARVIEAVTEETRVLIGHSLGSVVAYEVLASGECPHIEALITLGSPLGIQKLIFDRLRPAPSKGRGIWPRGVRSWVNVADRGDVVALEKRLMPLFGEGVTDILVHNGATAHDVRPYLTARETGRAIAAALGEGL
jgi:hypothetical protein